MILSLICTFSLHASTAPSPGMPRFITYSPNKCHTALAAINPSYSTLTIMQKPSWVHPPSSYKQDAVSSLSVAFEDPDGTKSKALLAECHLYLFGTRATVKKWKYHQNNKDNSKTSAAKHSQSSDSTDEQNIERSLQTQPPSSSLSATPAPHQTVPKMASESAFTTPSHPPRSATIKAHNAIKEAVAGDLDQ